MREETDKRFLEVMSVGEVDNLAGTDDPAGADGPAGTDDPAGVDNSVGAGISTGTEDSPDQPCYRLGIDAGSKTIKLVIMDGGGQILHSVYRRHRSDIRTTMEEILHDVLWSYGDAQVVGGVTGSAGIHLAQMLGLPHTQEVIATKRAVERFIPQTDVSIELGGEDAKIIYFRDGVEQRMNSTCAGGTGGFLESMAHLLGVHTAELDRLAGGYQTIYPIASRCAVFATTDLRPLLNAGARKADLAASAMQAVVTQVISGLAQGRPIQGNVAFLGGPFQHMNMLVFFFERALGLNRKQTIRPTDAHLFVAKGAALCAGQETTTLSDLQERLLSYPLDAGDGIGHLPPLFANTEEKETFLQRHGQETVPIGNIRDHEGPIFLGIDAGSTTVKLVAIDGEGKILYSDYRVGDGKVLNVSRKMLQELFRSFPHVYGGPSLIHVSRACVTGYGEDLLRTAFKVDEGQVETLAHLRAAREFQPQVDFVLDIGGQDIKCMHINQGHIEDVMLNEACSSGCGALIQGFARSLKRSQDAFAEEALAATNPVDLGTRCTVFMTSRVRHAQKEGVPVADIAAGLAYSVVRNALYKVIGISDPSQLGEHIVVQGGAFMSIAVLRAFELVSGREVVRPNIANLMGAYGAALLARDSALEEAGERFGTLHSSILDLEGMEALRPKRSTRRCQGCSNNCLLTINEFTDDGQKGEGGVRRLVSGNRCERFTVADGAIRGPKSRGAGEEDSVRPADGIRLAGSVESGGASAPHNLFTYEQELLKNHEHDLERPAESTPPVPRVGIPRVLELYGSFPFWSTFFHHLGCQVVSPSPTTTRLWRKGAASVLSESVCFPAKVAHGHVVELLEQGVDCIWMPLVSSSFPCIQEEGMRDCPVSTQYPQVLASLVGERAQFLMPDLREGLDAQAICELLRGAVTGLAALTYEQVQTALESATTAQDAFEEDLQAAGSALLEELRVTGERGLVLAAHPYHTDPGLSHGIDALAERLGFAVFSTRSLKGIQVKGLPEGLVAQEWTRERELYHVAQVVCDHPQLDFVQLYSFGCGIDPLAIDSIRGLLSSQGKGYTALKVDEMMDLATVRIRLRSLAATVSGQTTAQVKAPDHIASIKTSPLDQGFHTLVAPHLAPQHLQEVSEVLEKRGVELLRLPEPGRTAFEIGLRYLDNDLCYPTIAIIGQLLEHLLFQESIQGLALLAPQLCLGCRSVEMHALLQSALTKAGLGKIPIFAFPAFNGGDALDEGLAKELEEALSRADAQVASGAQVAPAGVDDIVPKVGIAGSIPLSLTPALNKHIQALIVQAGFTPVFPSATQLLESDHPLETALAFFAQQGIKDVIVLQAFGCMTSHVKGRGAILDLKRKYPGVHISFVEYDPGTSETNQLNRIQLALAVALDQ